MKTENVMILVINTGSTSTKLAVYRDNTELCRTSLDYSAEQLCAYSSPLDQTPMRKADVERFLQDNGYDITDFDVIASRGGAFGLFQGGGYEIDKAILSLIREPDPAFTLSGSWIAALIAGEYAEKYHIPAFFYNAVRTDEYCDLARYSGLSFIQRIPGCHALNSKEVCHRVASSMGKRYEDCCFLVCHLGGGISVEIHSRGKIIDNMDSEEGSFTPERAGRVSYTSLLRLCFSGKYSEEELRSFARGAGGLVDYLGTSDMREVENRIAGGDRKAEEVVNAMAYMLGKDIGALATTVCGKIDRIIFTGGIAYSTYFTQLLKSRVSWIAPVEILPGSFEMEALAHGVLRLYLRQEPIHQYSQRKE